MKRCLVEKQELRGLMFTGRRGARRCWQLQGLQERRPAKPRQAGMQACHVLGAGSIAMSFQHHTNTGHALYDSWLPLRCVQKHVTHTLHARRAGVGIP